MNPALIAALTSVVVALVSGGVTVYRVIVVDKKQVNSDERAAFRESEDSFRQAERDYRAEIQDLHQKLGESERLRRAELAASEHREAECQRDREALQAEIDRLRRQMGAP